MATIINNGGTGTTGAVAPPPKAIRFVNNQGQPPQKRRRINAACLTCRKRKTRCAGEHPTCSTCRKNGHVCLGYSDAVEKKRDAGSSLGADAASIEQDDDDAYIDEDPDDDRRACKTIKNGTKQHGQVEAVNASRRIPEPAASVQPKTERIDWDEQKDIHSSHAFGNTPRRPTTTRNTSFSTEDGRGSGVLSSPTLQHHVESHRVPYFRYFGPTAIVPGFRQMVVSVPDRRRGSMSGTATSPGSVATYSGFMSSMPGDRETMDDMPVYDPNDSGPVHPIILNLVDTFFLHLGCNYPFLRREIFPRLVREKQVEPILVDAVCALAARFSDLPIFTKWNNSKGSQANNGSVFAQRAKAATVDTFPCPTVAAVQACLLMAYEGFGADQDSALWMYLGIAIRMSVDLGLHKKDGVMFHGEKDPWYTRLYHGDRDVNPPGEVENRGETLSPQKQKELVEERINTLWSVFLLDRFISSGTGRPVTFRDEEFELALPKNSTDVNTGWPDPFPTLLQIIHLYGRVSDVLNKITSSQDLTRDKLNRLMQMERELTKLHQKQDPRLRFDATNFQKYVDNGQGTTFILLHFWFHALIIVLHQPTLLAPLVKIDRMRELAPHSREVSMSSAKTIADILAFAKLIDVKSFIGNPFTSQPIYIAACAFLVESLSNSSQPASRDATPPPEGSKAQGPKCRPSWDTKSSKRHLLLASAANQNYQACYNALKYMRTYWGGVRYILTALDQKSEGIWDCETYTREEYESTKLPRRNAPISQSQIESMIPPLAWSLTGTTNSPNSSLTLLFQNPNPAGGMPMSTTAAPQPPSTPASAPTPPGNMIYDPIRQSLPETAPMYPPAYPQPNTSALRHSVNPRRRRVSNASTQNKSLLRYDGLPPEDAAAKTPTTPESQLQGIRSIQSNSYTPSSQHSSSYEPTNYPHGASPANTLADMNPHSVHSQHQQSSHSANGGGGGGGGGAYSLSADGVPSNFVQSGSGLASSGYSYLGPTGQGMNYITYDNDSLTDIGQHLTSFEHTDMMSWLGDYMPSDVLGLYDNMSFS